MDNKKQQNKKKPSSGFLWVAALFLIGILRQLDLGTAFTRLQRMLRTGRFVPDETVIFALAVLIPVLIVIVAVAVRVARHAAKTGDTAVSPRRTAEDAIGARRRTAGEAHSHDRLSGYTAGSENADDHWKKQLDSFLEAGLIDRAEYRVLLERRRNDGYRR